MPVILTTDNHIICIKFGTLEILPAEHRLNLSPSYMMSCSMLTDREITKLLLFRFSKHVYLSPIKNRNNGKV